MVTRFGISFETGLLADFDSLIERKGSVKQVN